ncbi:MAG TPA: DinB family protein [Vicinamibacterales bacterium]|nr:DinB family protein [Vicinamibacterales bacterium]
MELASELLEAFVHSGRVSEYLVAVLPDTIWHAAPPSGRGRSIAAIVTHMQGVRRTFARTGRARVKGQPRRAVDMLTYLLQHDAHHRGQICVLARGLGHEFRSEDVTRLWGWKKLSRRWSRGRITGTSATG